MECNKCGHKKTKVIQTRLRRWKAIGVLYGHRLRQCEDCEVEFYTAELSFELLNRILDTRKINVKFRIK